jgi:hypothetical protein
VDRTNPRRWLIRESDPLGNEEKQQGSPSPAHVSAVFRPPLSVLSFPLFFACCSLLLLLPLPRHQPTADSFGLCLPLLRLLCSAAGGRGCVSADITRERAACMHGKVTQAPECLCSTRCQCPSARQVAAAAEQASKPVARIFTSAANRARANEASLRLSCGTNTARMRRRRAEEGYPGTGNARSVDYPAPNAGRR